MQVIFQVFLALLLVVSSSAGTSSSSSAEELEKIIASQDLQKLIDQSNSESSDWSSINQGLQFTRVNGNAKYNAAFEEAVSRFTEENDDGGEGEAMSSSVTALTCAANPYAEYSEYQLAWRYLGFAIDCTYYGQYNSHQRNMKSGDEQGSACARVLLYAVYVDVNYGDNGLDQYDFYNRTLDKWTGCSTRYYYYNNNNNNGNYRELQNNQNKNRQRCVKMDCHLSNSENFQLLGLFRNYLPNTWCEQLFKHEGVCVWGYNIYYNMKNIRQTFKPSQCTFVGYDSLSNPYYVGFQPLMGGNIGLALYSEERCYLDYVGSVTVSDVCGNYVEQNNNDQNKNNNQNNNQNKNNQQQNNNNQNNGGKRELKDDKDKKGGGHPCSFYKYQDYFNYQLDEWKLCHPCTSYDPKNEWDCYDDAGYTNCLQCMKFRNKAGSVPAGIEHIRLASRQNGIAEINVCGQNYGAGGFGSSLGRISFETAAESNEQAVKLYAKLSRTGANKTTEKDHSVLFMIGGIFIFAVVMMFMFDFNPTRMIRKKVKKDPLLSPTSGTLS